MPRPFPWIYPFLEDGPRLESVVLRPIVPIALVGREEAPPALALVDSGCEHVLAAPWLASTVGIDSGSSHRAIRLGIGGQTLDVRFVDLTLRLYAPDGGDDEYVEWSAEVGFVDHWRPTWPMIVGQVGFIDRFTITMSRRSQQLAIEGDTEFDRRFGLQYET
jgi:hypothetical protein